MHGFEHPSALAQLPVAELIHPEHRQRYDEFKRQLAASGSARLDSVDRRRDGSAVELEVRGSLLDRPRGAARTLAVLTDVTQRQQALQRQAQLARKALLAQEDERARVSRELHDELGQILTAVRLEVLLLQKEGLADEVRRQGLATAMQMITQAADELRRVCKGLRPPLLDDLGLEPAVRSLAEEFAERSGVRVYLEIRLDDTMEGPDALPGEVALCAYRVLQESLNNVRRHAEAREVNIALAGSIDEGLLLSIYDDGKGFAPQDEDAEGRYGIAGMRERAALVGGELQIRSVPGEGTRVVFRLPGATPKEKRR
jgi:PAS domain S-box-containing protein